MTPLRLTPLQSQYCEAENCRAFLVPFRSAAFRSILALRAAAYRSDEAGAADAIDEYSEHYLCTQKQKPVAALRVTRCQAGPLDCQEFMPQGLLEGYPTRIGSATRFVALQSVQTSRKISRLMVEAAWLDQLQRGIRLDVINVHERAISYYGKIGYELVEGSYFVHPKWRTPSHIMILPATPSRESQVRALFEGITDPLDVAAIASSIPLADWRSCRRSRRAS